MFVNMLCGFKKTNTLMSIYGGIEGIAANKISWDSGMHNCSTIFRVHQFTYVTDIIFTKKS